LPIGQKKSTWEDLVFFVLGFWIEPIWIGKKMGNGQVMGIS